MSYVVADTQNMILEVWRCICVFMLENTWALTIALWVKIGITESERNQNLFQMLSHNTKQNIATGTKDYFMGKKIQALKKFPPNFEFNFLTGAVNLSPSWDLAVSCHQSSDAFTLQLNNPRLIGCLLSATCLAWLTLYLVLGSAGKVQI